MKFAESGRCFFCLKNIIIHSVAKKELNTRQVDDVNIRSLSSLC